MKEPIFCRRHSYQSRQGWRGGRLVVTKSGRGDAFKRSMLPQHGEWDEPPSKEKKKEKRIGKKKKKSPEIETIRKGVLKGFATGR